MTYANEPPPGISKLDEDNWDPFGLQEPTQDQDLLEDLSDVEAEPPDDDTTVNLREAIDGAAAIEALDRIRVIRSPGEGSDDDGLGPSGIYVDPDAGCASDPSGPLRQEWGNGLAAHPFYAFHHMITNTRHWADVPRDVDLFLCNRRWEARTYARGGNVRFPVCRQCARAAMQEATQPATFQRRRDARRADRTAMERRLTTLPAGS